jgi:hypothetical protein
MLMGEGRSKPVSGINVAMKARQKRVVRREGALASGHCYVNPKPPSPAGAHPQYVNSRYGSSAQLRQPTSWTWFATH